MEEGVKSGTLSSTRGSVEEGILIKKEEWGRVRALHGQGMRKVAIARELKLDVKTVRKWLRLEYKPQRRNIRRRAMEGYGSFIEGRGPEVGFNGAVLLREMKGLGYRGSYSALARYIKPLREASSLGAAPTQRYETEPGGQAQVDWGSTSVWLGEQEKRVHLFVMVLGYSRRIFAKGYTNERLDSLFDGHACGFAHFGGRTRRILYDNPRTIVLRKDEASGQVEWNRSFKDRIDFYGVEAQLCRFYRAQTKGKVESGVKYVKRNALAGKRFRDIEELNAWLLQWSVEVADQRIHGTTHERPVDRFRREEAGKLQAVDTRQPAQRERLERRMVPPDAYVTVETNRYPAPVEWVGQQIEVRILPSQIILNRSGADPVVHSRLTGKHAVARWNGAARSWSRPAAALSIGPPRFDPATRGDYGEVQLRPLACYEALIEEVAL
jgi:transposase